MRAVVYEEDQTSVYYADLVRAERGKKRLRQRGQAEVVINHNGAAHRVTLHLIEKPAWRGGTRSFIACPSCGKPVLKVLWHADENRFKCHHCWGPQLRYRSQERRRLKRKKRGSNLIGDHAEQ